MRKIFPSHVIMIYFLTPLQRNSNFCTSMQIKVANFSAIVAAFSSFVVFVMIPFVVLLNCGLNISNKFSFPKQQTEIFNPIFPTI